MVSKTGSIRARQTGEDIFKRVVKVRFIENLVSIIRFLGLLQQVTANKVACNNINLFFSVMEARTQFKVLLGLHCTPFEMPRRKSCLASFSFWWLLTFIGLGVHNFSLCHSLISSYDILLCVFSFLLCVSPLRISYKDTSLDLRNNQIIQDFLISRTLT